MLAHGLAQADDSLTLLDSVDWVLGCQCLSRVPKFKNIQTARFGSYSVPPQVFSERPACLSLLLERVGRPPVVFFVARQRLLAAKMLAWHVLRA